MMLARRACALVLVVLAWAPAGAAQRKQSKAPPLRPIAPLDLARALDLYSAGRFDEAVRAVANAGDEIGRNLRRHWPVTGRQWIDADPAQRPRRLLVAASLALETEHVRAERGDWRVSPNPFCAAACVLDWAQLLFVERGAPDAAERAWYLAAAALASGGRDWQYLYRPVDPARQRGRILIPGLMDRALARFPGDPALRLEAGIAAAGRFNQVVDGANRVTIDDTTGFPPNLPRIIAGRLPPSLVRFSEDALGGAVSLLSSLAEDPAVGAEARFRLGYLHWARGRDEAAVPELTAAAEKAGDAETRYLARFLLGWTAIARGDNATAIPHLEAALAARPDSQSAALALGALELQRGDADKAHEIARASLERRAADVDPWRLFLYGHHPRWPALIAGLRAQVGREMK